MSLWSRIANVFRSDRLNRDIDEELESHIAEAMEQGRSPEEVRKVFGSVLRQRETSRDIRLVPWLDALRADVIFGWRQLKRNRITSAAAILSLGVAIGACTSAFRLIDALLLRPLPIADPANLYAISYNGFGPEGKPYIYDSNSYPMFQKMRAAVRDQAELIAVSYAGRTDLTYSSDQETEKAFRQNVSGWMFSSFGLRPALGRLLTESDDSVPGKEPYAVISYDYWTRRFNRDPKTIGKTFRIGNTLYQIIGVAPKGFTGTEPGVTNDIYIPTMMNPGAVESPNSFWLRIFIRPKPGVAIQPLEDKLHSIFQSVEKERSKAWTNFPKEVVERFAKTRLVLIPAAQGVSQMQNEYRSALTSIAVLVALVLLIACANVANLMTAQSAARMREMALRVSIGAGRWRLVQMVLVESMMLAVSAAILGALFAWWSAPLVVSMINIPDNPAHLVLPADVRVLCFGIVLIIFVTLLFGLLPALRASSVKPVTALKGGEAPHARRRSMHAMIALQVAFCFVVLFIAGLFVTTFRHLMQLPIGFSADRLLTVDTVTPQPVSQQLWEQVADHLRSVPGVKDVSISQWPPLSGFMSNDFISIHGERPTAVAFFMFVSPGWLDTMRIPLLSGRDFRPEETSPGTAIVNQAFAKQFFNGENPVGRTFATTGASAKLTRYTIVGLSADAVYRNIREPMLPAIYAPIRSTDADGKLNPLSSATFMIKTASDNPLALATTLRREVPRARSEFRVSNILPQQEYIDAQTIRERMLSMLAFFFAGVALLLAGIGLYGVLSYSVIQREREIGIRLALGAPVANIARRVTADIFIMVMLGAGAGVALGIASADYIESLLFQVKPTTPLMIALPLFMILGTAILTALPAVLRAMHVDPATMLRSE